MSRRVKEINPYYMEQEDKEKIEKQKEREKRINQKRKLEENDRKFEIDTESVINMTNKNKIKKEEEKRKKISKEERKRKKRIKRIKFFAKMFLIIARGITFALTSPIFNIKDIKVSNNITIPSDTIVSLSSLKTDENIFRFYNGDIVNKIKENPYVESVEIKRKLPSTIEIYIIERVATYCIDYMGKFAYINTQGYILEISENSRGMPVIQGVTTNENDILPGNRLNTDDLKRLEKVIRIMNAAKDANLDGQVTAIDISDENEYSIYLNDEKKTVYLGDASNLSNKMLYVQAIIEQEKGKEGEIFVNGDLNNKFHPYFREKV